MIKFFRFSDKKKSELCKAFANEIKSQIKTVDDLYQKDMMKIVKNSTLTVFGFDAEIFEFSLDGTVGFRDKNVNCDNFVQILGMGENLENLYIKTWILDWEEEFRFFDALS